MDAKNRALMLRDAWFDRDLAWLEFNRRVLAEALDARVPLLERLKFLGIFSSNLDEFFMKRVGAMRTRAYASGNIATIEEFNAHILNLREALFPMLLQVAECFEELKDRLAALGVGSPAGTSSLMHSGTKRGTISIVTSRQRSRR